MQRNYDHNTSMSRTMRSQNYQSHQTPTITINREQTYLTTPTERTSNRHVTRSYSNNTSFVRSNGDESRLDKLGPFREYGDYHKSNITNLTSANNNSHMLTMGEKKNRRVGRTMAARKSWRGVPGFWRREWYLSSPVELRSLAAFFSRMAGA